MKLSYKKNPYFIISAAIVTVSVFVTFAPPLFVEFLEAKTFDIRFLLRGQRDPGPEVVIVGIDDVSLKKVGRWPWSRDKFALLLKNIEDAGAAAVGIDVIFSESQVTDEYKTIRELKNFYSKQPFKESSFIRYMERMEKNANVDNKLAAVIKDGGNVVLPIVFSVPTKYEKFKEEEAPDVIYNYSFIAVKKSGFYRPIVAEKAILPLPVLTKASSSLGHVYTHYDKDGAIRWEPLYVEFGGSHFPSFGIEIARNYMGLAKEDLKLQAGEGVIMGDQFIPTDVSGRALINYSGRKGSFMTYPAVDVMEGNIASDALRGKIVMIGTTGLGTTDTHVTPFAQLPGIEKQAAVVENIIHGNFLRKEEWTKLLDFTVIIIFGLSAAAILPKMRAHIGALIVSTLILAYLAFVQFVFGKYGMWINVVIPVSTAILLYSSVTAFRFFTEEKRATAIKGIFSSYVTERVVNQLLENPEMAKLGGERRDVTILFSDIRGFTTFSETQSPEDVVAILNEYLTAMTEVVFRWEGTLDKFIGDAVMVFWGAPLKQDNHAELGVKCAMHMVKRLEELREKWKAEGKPLLEIGIGLNSGEVLVGNIGAEGKKMDYTVIGDNVNLASRVESLTKRYGVEILMTEFTMEKIRELVNTNKMGHISVKGMERAVVKGKNQPVGLYECKGLDPESVSVLTECDENNVVVLKEK